MRIHGTIRLLAATSAVAVALPSAAHAHLILFPGKGGANTVWISANDAGQAVGQKLKGPIDDFVYFDGKHPHDLTGRLGHGAFSSIDPLGEAAGTTSTGFPLYFNTRNGHKAILQMPGRATGIALGPLVAVSLSSGAAELWNPLSGATLSLGNATTSGVSASGIVVGHAADGNLWYSVPNGSGGATQHELPVSGNFDRINNQNVATGYERTGGRLLPVRFTIPAATAASAHASVANGLTVYRLLHGYDNGVLAGINDIGTVAFGNVGRNDMLLPSTAVTWPAPDRPKKVPLKGLVAGVYRHFSSDISFYNDIGWFGGAITVKEVDIAYLYEPTPISKIVGLRKLAHSEPWVTDVADTDVVGRLSTIHHLLAKGNKSASCVKLIGMHRALQDEHDYVLSHFTGADADYFLDVYDDLLDGLDGLGMELGCDPHKLGFVIHLGASPMETQSPYAGTPLAWNTPTY